MHSSTSCLIPAGYWLEMTRKLVSTRSGSDSGSSSDSMHMKICRDKTASGPSMLTTWFRHTYACILCKAALHALGRRVRLHQREHGHEDPTHDGGISTSISMWVRPSASAPCRS
jgi:hypothetical protein